MNTIFSNLLPIFILPFLGYFANRLHVLHKDTGNHLCSLLYLFCMPASAFINITNSKIEDIFNIRFALATLTYELIMFGLLSLIYRKLYHVQCEHAVINALCGFYGNVAYVGIPVFLSLFNNIIPNTITIMIHVSLIFPLVIFLLDKYTNKEYEQSLKSMIKKTGSIVIKNPNIMIPCIGAILIITKIHIPKVALSCLDLLGKPTTSMGLFALGFNCCQSDRIHISMPILKKSLMSVLFKLIISPIIAFLIGKFIFSLDQWWLSALTIMAMLPSALNDYIISQQYHTDEDFAKFSVLLSTLFFSVTISIYILFFWI